MWSVIFVFKKEIFLKQEIKKMVTIALNEDLADSDWFSHDISSNLIDVTQYDRADIVAKEKGIFCGQLWVDCIVVLFDNSIKIEWFVQDKETFEAGKVLFSLYGKTKHLLTIERTILNFVQLLSGVATKTHEYVKLIEHTKANILDTRKTIPGFRYGQKYAVFCGGGVNHRFGLYDAYLLKENHLFATGGISKAVAYIRQSTQHRDIFIEVEVETLAELEEALAEDIDRVMLDNFTFEDINKAVSLKNSLNSTISLEVSGNVNKDNIVLLAETGVDFISVGDITKNNSAIDLSMRLQ